MSGEILTILGVGIALGGLIYTGMARLENRLGGRVSALESRMDGRISALEAQIGELRERMARLEGLLEGLREAITGRAAAG